MITANTPDTPPGSTPLCVVLWATAMAACESFEKQLRQQFTPAARMTFRRAIAAPDSAHRCELGTPSAVAGETKHAIHLLLDPAATALRDALLAGGTPFNVLYGTPHVQLQSAIDVIRLAQSAMAPSAVTALDASPRWRWHCPHCSDADGEAHALHTARALRALAAKVENVRNVIPTTSQPLPAAPL